MKNSLVNTVKEGVNQIGKKVILPLAFVAGSYVATAQDRPYKSDYKKHDKGASFSEYKANSNDVLEEKIFYNPVTKEDEPFYIQHLNAEERKKYDNDLDIGAMSSDELKSAPLIGLKSGKVYAIVGDEFYHFFPEERKKLVLEETHIKNLCIDQKKLLAEGINPETMTSDQASEKAAELRGENYIFTSNIKDYIKAFTGNNVLTLENGDAYVVIPLTADQQEEGKTNVLLMRLSDDNLIIPEKNKENGKKNIAFYADFYRGIAETDSEGELVTGMIDAESGLVGRLIDSDSTDNVDNIKETIKESGKSKQRDFYLISGVSGNGEFLGLDIGAGYGPVAIRGRVSKAKDEPLVHYPGIPSPNTGRVYGTMKENVDVSELSVLAEVRPFQDKFVTPVIGAGPNKTEYTRLIQENGDHKSFSEKEWSAIVEGGVSLGKKDKLDLLFGWKTRKIPELNMPINQTPKDNFKNQAYFTVSYVRNLGGRK